MACEANVIGAAFIQPQRIGRASFDDSAAEVVQDLLNLVMRLTAEGVEGGAIADALGESLETVALRMLERSKEGFERARVRLQALLRVFLDSLTELGRTMADIDDPADVAEAGQQLLSKLAAAAEGLTAEGLRRHVAELLDILENDLGLTGDFIEQQIWAVFDELSTRLGEMPPGADAAERETRLEMISLVRRIKRQLAGRVIFPRLNADQLAGLLLDLLRQSGIETIARKAACAASGLGEAVSAGGKLIEAVPFRSSFVAGGTLGAAQPRAAGAEYCWYATWLLGAKAIAPLRENKVEHRWGAAGFLDPFYPFVLIFDNLLTFRQVVPKERRLGSDEIWINKEHTKVMMGDEVLVTGADVKWTDIPVFAEFDGRYSFGSVSREGMENWTRVTAWLADYLIATLHFIPELSIKKGDVWSYFTNGLERTTQGTVKVAAGFPLSWWLSEVSTFGPGWLRAIIDKTILVGPTVFGSLEGNHSNASPANWFGFQLTQTLGDVVKTFQHRAIIGTVRDFWLTTLTLYNFKGPVRIEPPLDGPFPFYKADVPDDRPQNRAEIDGVADAIAGLFNLLLAKLTPRKYYGHPFKEAQRTNDKRVLEMWLGWMLGAGLGFGLLGGFVGATTAEIIAWAEDWGVLGKKMLQSVFKTWVMFWPTLYFGMEGNTDDGKYNPAGGDFKGYPDYETSPYLLPYPQDEARVCGQGNQGMWSHNDLGNRSQVYAFDFGLDQDEPVLAARAGTVVDFFEGNPDDDDTTANYVVIRHDAGLTFNAQGRRTDAAKDHDLDARGAQTVTYGVYLHGRMNSVTRAFAARTPAVATGAIRGTVVARGDLIMFAGDTGTSFHNHLHIQVQTNPNPPAPPVPGMREPAGFTRSSLNNWTIPFVFKDVWNLIGTNGVPKALTYYTSDNPRNF